MVQELHSLIEAVRSREERRRRTAIAINAALCISVLAVPWIILQHYPTLLLLAWLPPIAVAAIYISRSEYESIQVTKEEASEILDVVLKTKERVRTFALISQSSAAPDLIRSEFIAGQIQQYLPETCTPENLLDISLTKPQRWAVTATIVALLIAAALLWLRPVSPLQQVAATLQAIVDAHPELPEQVKVAVQESIQNLGASDLAAAQESLQRTQSEISKALSEKSLTQNNERTIQQSNEQQELQKQAAPQIEPRKEEKQQNEQQQEKLQPQEKKKEQQQAPQEPSKEDKKNEEKQEQSSTADQKNNEEQQKKERQPSEDSKEKSEQGSSEEGSQNQEQEGQSKEEQDSKKDGKSKSGQSNKSEDGDGQGSGQGEGSSGAGAGDQGENKEKGQNSQGSSGDAKDGKGTGEGNSQGSKAGEQGQPQSSSDKDGEQQDGSSPGASGLEQLKDAVGKAEQELQKEQPQDQQAQEGKDGKDGKGQGEGDKESESGKEDQKNEGERKGEQGAKPKGQQQGKGDSQEKENKKGEAQGKDGEGDKDKPQTPSGKKKSEKEAKEQGESGNSGTAKKQEEQQKTAEERDSEDGKSDGVGDHSSIPDRSAKAVNEEPPSNGAGGDMPNIPLTGEESKVEGKDEQLDSRFTGTETTLEENKAPAHAKTTLDDVLLAKPQGSTHKGQQPIPLEYKEILE